MDEGPGAGAPVDHAPSGVPGVVAATMALLHSDTGVPAGRVVPDAELVARRVREDVQPLLEALAPDEVRRHPTGELAVRIGPDRPDGLVLVGYVVAQHGDPDDRRVELRDDGAVLVGRGVAQCKGALGAAVDAVGRLDRGALRRPVWLCVNTEGGGSSHGGSRRILGDLAVRGARAVVLTGTDLDVSVANRGRVDLEVTISGRGGHSSRPEGAANPFDGLDAVLGRIAGLPRPPDDPDLGPASATVFGVRSDPVAPHTVPDRLVLVLDRRLLPGETPDAVIRAARAVLAGDLGGGLTVSVEEGAWMLPAQVDPGDPLVATLVEGVRAAGGRSGPVVSRHTFDAGWACSLGIPTVMFGPGRRSFGHDVTEVESVGVRDLAMAADALVATASGLCSA